MCGNRKIKFFACILSAFFMLSPYTSIEVIANNGSEINININTYSDKKLISPYIYGISDTTELDGLTVRAIKQGGDKLSTYNWENNFSNTGSEWFNTNNNSLVSNFETDIQQQPALIIQDLVNKSVKYNIPFSITTLPMIGFVSADGDGPILNDQIAPSSRWIPVQNKKGTPFSLTPDMDDDYVYVDEYLNYIITKYGKSTALNGIKAYALDHQPDLWATSQSSVHPTSTTCFELMQRSTDLAMLIKGLDEHALVFGGQFSGMNAYISFNNANDWDEYKADYNWFLDYYLAEMKRTSLSYGKRLLDVLDVHYYSQDSYDGSESVVDCDDYTNIECNKVRMQSTRTLWDSTYTENSWIGQSYKQYTPLLPTIQASINKNYSGTKLALTEYNFGGGGDISGGIAEADALGIFGKEGVFLACLNPSDQNIKYQKAAINLFTNYDGNGSSFGNTSVNADTSDIINSSVYASINNADENVLKIILINKNYDTKQTAKITIDSNVEYKGGNVYGFNSKSSDITRLSDIRYVKNNNFSYELAPRSVVEIILTTNGLAPEVTTSDFSYDNSDSVSETQLTQETTVSDFSSGITNETSQDMIQSESEVSVSYSSAEVSNTDEYITDTNSPNIEQKSVPIFVKILTAIVIFITFIGIGYLLFIDIFKAK